MLIIPLDGSTVVLGFVCSLDQCIDLFHLLIGILYLLLCALYEFIHLAGHIRSAAAATLESIY